MNTVSKLLLDMHDNAALPITDRERLALHDAAWVLDHIMDGWSEAVSGIADLQARIAWSEDNLAVTKKEDG